MLLFRGVKISANTGPLYKLISLVFLYVVDYPMSAHPPHGGMDIVVFAVGQPFLYVY